MRKFPIFGIFTDERPSYVDSFRLTGARKWTNLNIHVGSGAVYIIEHVE